MRYIRVYRLLTFYSISQKIYHIRDGVIRSRMNYSGRQVYAFVQVTPAVQTNCLSVSGARDVSASKLAIGVIVSMAIVFVRRQ